MQTKNVPLFVVVYTVQGQRHRHLAHLPLKEANALCDQFRRDKWNAWVEPVG